LLQKPIFLNIFAALLEKGKQIFYETHLSAFKEKKKEQARFPRAHGICQRPQSVGKSQKKWQKEADRF
jgi:hypothetical protein